MKSSFRRRSLLLILCAFFLLQPCAGPAEGQTQSGLLKSRLARIIDHGDTRRGFWGIVVAELPDGKVLYSHNEDHLFQPASNMKLFTTAAALVRLGPDFVFRTTVESDGKPDAQGTLGDLFLVGRGDPNISGRVLPYQYNSENNLPADAVLRELAAEIAARGIREVRGDVVADDRYFLYEPFGGEWSVEDLQWGYGAPVTALAVNDNKLGLHVLAGLKDGDPAVVWLDPFDAGLQINNRVVTTAPGTGKDIHAERMPGTTVLDIWGQIPAGSPQDDDTVAMPDPPRLAAELFKRDLEMAGVAVRGRVRVLELPRSEAASMENPFAADPARVVLAEHRSLPLSVDLKVTDKVSQNLHAEMLLRTLGHEAQNYGSLTAGLRVLNEFAGDAGIDPEEIHFTDGSGLSRLDLVTPAAIVKLLIYMAKVPNFLIYFDSLPVAGVDGTLGTRFVKSPAAGRIHAKTGTLGHVSTLSGYMDLPTHKQLVFSVMVDNYAVKTHQAVRELDAVVEAIYDTYGGRPRRTVKRRRPKPKSKTKP